MPCDSCNDTTVDINCPEPSGIEGATLYSQYYTQPETPADIFNAGAGYDVTLYTNTSAVNQYITIESNMYISTTTNPHTLTTVYKNDGVTVTTAGTLIHEAPTKSDHTHFMIQELVAPGKSITMNILSDDTSGKLNWLVAMIYKY